MTTTEHIKRIREALESPELCLADGWYGVADRLLPAEDMRLVAACSPDALRAILDELAKLKDQKPAAWMRANYSGTESPTLQFEPPGPPTIRDSVVAPVWTPLYAMPPMIATELEQQRAQMLEMRAALRSAQERRRPASVMTVHKKCRAADPAGEDLCNWSAATGWRAAERHHGITPASEPQPPGA